MGNELKFCYLNLENRWPLFDLRGLKIGDRGELKLAKVPRFGSMVIGSSEPEPLLKGPVGLDVDIEGNIYVADPLHHQILRVDACDGQSEALPCLRGPGWEPGQLNEPRGVLIGPRHALYVADSGNHRVQVVDLATQQLREIWGQPDPWNEPTASDAQGCFHHPWDLTIDRRRLIYVSDPGSQDEEGQWHFGRVQKFRVDGKVDPTFWENMRDGQPPGSPVNVSVILIDVSGMQSERLLVLDQQPVQLLVYRLDGSYDSEMIERWKDISAYVEAPIGLAFDGQCLYIGDTARKRVVVFDHEGVFIGEAKGYQQTVAGLTLDRRGGLLVHSGSGATVSRLIPGSAYVESGSFMAGPFNIGEQVTHWYRLEGKTDPLPEGCHLQLFTCTSNTMDGVGEDRPDLPVTCEGLHEGAKGMPLDEDLTSLDSWRIAPRDAWDLLILNKPGRYLWIGGILSGSGGESPILHQMRLEYDHEGWIQYLPNLYQRDEKGREFLERALSPFESLLQEEEQNIEGLLRLCDPWATPDESPLQPWLDWLASWLAFELDETWEEEKRRTALSTAFELYAQRGTIRGLRRILELYCNATVHITETARFASLWSLGESSVLGFNTMIAPAHAQGAVIGTTATLSQSHLIQEGEYGVPLYDDIAHHFCVEAYEAELYKPELVEKVRRVLDQEKPAHITYQLCIIQPKMRVGFQARIGIDSIVGGPAPELLLDEPLRLGLETVLPQG